MVEKGWNPLLPVDHLKKNLLTIHPTAKDFHDMCKKACDTASKCIADTKEYKKQRWDKLHMEPDFKGPKKMGDFFVGPFTIIKLIGKGEVEVRLTEEFSRKHPVFPVCLLNPYFQTEEEKLPSRRKNTTPPEIL
ncbi:hypothetical protein O181_037952 [Austropuccinia psidii MF-1]|uniref:Uncharacterized protein n=1 Tax=Austropuccinia psidii MF-1 TaxID=1389203 RepID=A0A9Q3HBF6_9BASI|nr:hypothetical protein [Austropuccinia psidii MF-1]